MFKSSDKQVVINIESGTVVRVLVLVVITLLALSFFERIAHPLTLIAISFFFALGLNPIVTAIANRLRAPSRVKATAGAYVLVIAFLGLFISFVVPPLIRQTVDFVQEVPNTIENVTREDSSFNHFVQKYNLQEDVNKFSDEFGNRFKDIDGPLLSTVGTIGSALISLVTVLVLTFMMLVEGHTWLNRFWSIQDPKKREHRQKLARRMYRVVTNYFNGQVFIALLGGLFASVVIYILSQIFDAPVNAIALGGIIGMFALLPLIGTIIGSIIVVLACLLVSIPLAIAVGVYFIVYQQIENVTIQPYIQSRGSNLTPLIVFVAAILGIGFGGFLGAVVSIPIAGCIKILIEDYFEQRAGKKLKEA